MRFSQKIGKSSIRENIQVESIDIRLENRLWNTVLLNFFDELSDIMGYKKDSPRGEICLIIWKEFFGERVDEISRFNNGNVYASGFLSFLKEWFFKSEWYKKYDLIEYLSQLDSALFDAQFSERCNDVLKIEMAGYRIVDDCIVHITTEEEIVEIEEALVTSSQWDPVNTHLRSSIEYFSNRENPDYRNTIKEAILAVEALCTIISGGKKATLGQALSNVEKKYKIHGALKSAFTALYGYTSDSGGIRHALLEDDISVSFEDAKFMLVSCSAFLNYLKVKIEK